MSSPETDTSLSSLPWWRKLPGLRRKQQAGLPVSASVPLAGSGIQLEQQMYANIAQLGTLEAYDVMVPRADIVGIDSKAATVEILRTMRTNRFLRFPVYRHTLDDIIGYIEIRQVFDLLSQNKPLEIYRILEKPLFIVRSTRLLDLMVQMRQTHTYLAIVVDEYGGVDGLLTIEDVVETITGMVQATSIVETSSILPQGDGVLLVDARTEIHVFEQRLGRLLPLEEENHEVDTVGGYIYVLAGRIPGRGEIIPVDDHLHFEVVEADPRQLKWLRAVSRQPATTQAAE